MRILQNNIQFVQPDQAISSADRAIDQALINNQSITRSRSRSRSLGVRESIVAIKE